MPKVIHNGNPRVFIHECTGNNLKNVQVCRQGVFKCPYCACKTPSFTGIDD